MTFPSGGPGYPQQGQPSQGPPPSGGFPQQPQPQQGPPAAGAGAPPNLPLLLSLGVAGLGVVQYFLGFASEAGTAGQPILFLLVGGLLSALNLLPKGPKTLPFAALFSVVGGLGALDAVISGRTSAIVIVVLILGLLQAAASVAVLLFEYGVLKPPAPQPSAPAYQQPYGQQGQYQPTQYQPAPGQQGQQPPQAPGQQPPSSPTPGQQATTYAPQQGQFFQPPADQNKPGTPPGGFGQQG
ncbi:34 kDa antigenic family protein [Amycolatopsis rubida]|uniref:34 kDa antigenic family protein n=1 Tax=Amycolatopsis rubida TaxID=112413 RepID=A0ABX0BTC1_9PSEU|nr:MULTISPECIES: DUF5336 domain-containing protein [Amycolatopsis]MYW93634.1 hypothetical protein [Amycolatopsis rubida]NEC58621.1 34 kDa antigenic family protein [Amycolatopsis rubida]OAP23118.1 hypothetical protein A4R44_06200 [Amycolatopsis sp. M39]